MVYRWDCGCPYQTLRCYHIEGQWALAIYPSADGGSYWLLCCPGFDLGRDKRFRTSQEAAVEFDQRVLDVV